MTNISQLPSQMPAGYSRHPRDSYFQCTLARLALLTVAAMPLAGFGAAGTWNGSVSTDWNDGANWTGGIPSAGNASINSIPANICTISADLAATPLDIIVGSSAAGQVNQTAGYAFTGSGNWLILGQNSAGVGTYNMTGGTMRVGGIHLGRTGSGTSVGTLNIGGTITNTTTTVLSDGQNASSTGQGTINVNSGGTLFAEQDMIVAFAGNSTAYGQLNINAGGTVNVASTLERWLIVNQWDTVQGRIVVNGGTLNLNANTDIRFSVGNSGSVGVSYVTVTNGGAINGGASSVIDMNRAGGTAAVNNTVNLDGGTLTISQIMRSSGAGGTRAFNFNGGTLRASAANTAFLASGVLSVANVRNGGAVIDTAGFDITIGQALAHSAIGGDAATDGGLTKLGNGILTLAAANTLNGPVRIGGGTVYVNPGNAANNRAFSFVSSITVSNGATLKSGPNGLFGWDGSQTKPITVNAGATLTTDAVNGEANVGIVTLNGGTLAGAASPAWGSINFGRSAGGGKLIVTEDSSVTALNVGMRNGTAIDVAAGKTLTFSGTVSDLTSEGVCTMIKSGGTGTLLLTSTNTYSGTTTISNGTLTLSATGSIPNTPTITVVSGATFDVSAAGFSLGAGKTLRGGGTVLGSLTTAGSTSTILPGSGVGALTITGNLNLSAGASATFELSTSAASGNDKIVVGGNLNLSSSDVIRISALSGAAALDDTADYVLFAVAGTTTMSGIPALVWDGTPPANYLNFTVVQSGNDVVLRYTAATAPTVTAIATPNPATRNQPVTIAATITPGSGNIASVMADLSSVGGSAATSLVLSNDNVYTNSVAVSGSTTIGAKSFLVTVTDDTSPTPLIGTYTITSFNVVATNQVWNGAGSDDNWSTNPNWASGAAPGLSGDGVTFAGTTRLTPNLDANLSVTSLTFDSTAGGFNLGTANASTLTLTGGVTNNSTNAQTISVPVSLSASSTLNATGNVMIAGAITGTGGLTKVGNGTLTLAGNFTSTGVLQGNGGTTVIASLASPGGAEVWAGASGSTGAITVTNGGTLVVSNWLVAGRDGAGTINVNGGNVVRAGGGNITVGTLGTAPTGTLNLNSGTISNLAGETYLGEGSSAVNFGNYNQSGGYATLGNLYLGRGTGSGQGIGKATITGGTLDVGNLEIAYGNNNTRIGTNVMTIGSGATVNSAGYVRLAFAGSSSMWGLLTNNGGTLNVGAAALYMGYWPDGCSAVVTHNSGALNLRNNSSIIFGQNGNAGPGNVFVQNGGTVTFYSDAGVTMGGTGSLNLGNSGSGAHTYTLAGGTLTVPQIRKAGGTSTATFNFNGGTLKPTASSTTFLQGLSAANVQSGGAVIDTDGKNITVNQSLLDGGGGGGLTKNGNGTLSLNGVNTFTGLTTVNAGTLGGTGSLAGGLNVGASATLAAGNSIGTFTVNGAATLNGTVVAEITNGPSADLINFAGGATLGGTLTVVANGTLTSGQTFNLFDGSLSGTFGTVNLPGGPAHWNTSALYTSGEITFANASPLASNFDLGVAVGGSATASVIGKYVSDADGDAVTVTFVSTPANGTASIVGGTNITYTSTSAAASDTFTYTVTDSLGATDTKTVTVIISSPTGFNLISGPTPLGGGQLAFGYLGIPGEDYAIEETSSLTPPITWTPVATNTASGNGAVSFTITPSNPSGYFRTRHVP